MSRDYNPDKASVFGDTHAAAEAASEVRFRENFEKPLCPACYHGRHGPAECVVCGCGKAKHRGVRRRLDWRSALVLLRERAWRR